MELWTVDLGTRGYADAWALQKEVARARIAGELEEDVLLLVEHPPVVTLGRSSKAAHLMASPALLAARGVEVHEVERGGDVTFHGPGQLVGYPIVDLKRHRRDLHWYLRQIEESLIVAVRAFGIDAGRNPGYTGVWVGPESEPGLRTARKLASIGVHARDWVTWHGFALNVTTDLRWFDLIVPCGIQDVTMTSLARECERPGLTLAEVGRAVADGMGEVFGLRPGPVPADRWRRIATPLPVAAGAAGG
jgi:lipoyl(octanoyl) transferase